MRMAAIRKPFRQVESQLLAYVVEKRLN